VQQLARRHDADRAPRRLACGNRVDIAVERGPRDVDIGHDPPRASLGHVSGVARQHDDRVHAVTRQHPRH
jgi:hypothetical protein